MRIFVDLDDTIIDSNHRLKYDDNKVLDMEHYIANHNRDNVFKDKKENIFERLGVEK